MSIIEQIQNDLEEEIASGKVLRREVTDEAINTLILASIAVSLEKLVGQKDSVKMPKLVVLDPSRLATEMWHICSDNDGQVDLLVIARKLLERYEIRDK